MVECEYYFTETLDPVDDEGMHGNHTVNVDNSLTLPGSEYAWKYGHFSDCSVSCGTGLIISTASCEDLRHPGRNIPDSICLQNLAITKPLPIVQKCHLRECQARWGKGKKITITVIQIIKLLGTNPVPRILARHYWSCKSRCTQPDIFCDCIYTSCNIGFII